MIPLKDNIPSRTFPVTNVTLIIINSIAFLYEVSLGVRVDEFVMRYGLVPVKFLFILKHDLLNLHQAIIPVFTSMFL
ncbi:TPA: rhomboid family intramembrane serine protease, partial [Candidatus Poribacteria bacterium]|nr:rhomboid family intramembrane serine protease [Candidatus Poribacteria bacterium]